MKAIFNIGYTTATPPASYTGERRADYIAKRNFYNLTADYNYFTYTLNGQKVSKNANAEHYFTREGTNTGLFNMDGAIDEEKKNELKARLKDTESTIWHGFISFDDETSRGFTNQENCVKFMRQTFGSFLERAGFKKSNIELYCSLHEDTDHRHIHFAFFEKEPLRLDKSGNLGFTRRGKISSVAIDNYLVSANMHLSEHGAEYYTARDKAITELNRLRETRARTGFIDSRASTASLMLNVELNRLIAKLPATGRLQYNAQGMEKLRPNIDKIAELLIRSDARAFETPKPPPGKAFPIHPIHCSALCSQMYTCFTSVTVDSAVTIVCCGSVLPIIAYLERVVYHRYGRRKSSDRSATVRKYRAAAGIRPSRSDSKWQSLLFTAPPFTAT